MNLVAMLLMVVVGHKFNPGMLCFICSFFYSQAQSQFPVLGDLFFWLALPTLESLMGYLIR